MAQSVESKEHSLENYLYASDKARMKAMVAEMTDHARTALTQALEALKTLDLKEAAHIIASDDVIDDLEEQVDQECLYSIAMRQPMREDLRFVYAVMKIITDMERVGDQAVNIARRTIKYAESTEAGSIFPKLAEITDLGRRCDAMIGLFLEAFENEDGSALERMRTLRHEAQHICDSEVALLMQRLASPYLAETPMEIFCCIWVIRHLGRISDHMMNLAEKVYFIATGISPLTLKRRNASKRQNNDGF